jgi:ATP-binding protein involved in chromosome partitioning
MNLKKEDIQHALSHVITPGSDRDIVATGALKNIQVFGSEVDVDVTISVPTLQAKKKLEVDILKTIHDRVFEKAVVKVNIKVEKPETPPEIKGPELPGVKNIIAVASGKGGVGKSTVTANLAVSLSNMGFTVGIVDADIYGPSMHLMFDIEKEKPRSIEINGRSMMQPVENYGVKVLSIGFFAQADQAVVWRGPMATKALNQLIKDAYWGNLDFLLIDLPPGTGDIHLSLVQAVPVTGGVIVSTPQNIALADARKGVAMFKMPAINVPVLGIVENMSYFTPAELPDHKYYIFGESGARNLAERMEVPFLGEIPLVQSIREAGDVGRPAVLQENTTTAEAFNEMAKNVVEQVAHRNQNLSPTEKVRITTMAGCSAVKK